MTFNAVQHVWFGGLIMIFTVPFEDTALLEFLKSQTQFVISKYTAEI